MSVKSTDFFPFNAPSHAHLTLDTMHLLGKSQVTWWSPSTNSNSTIHAHG